MWEKKMAIKLDCKLVQRTTRVWRKWGRTNQQWAANRYPSSVGVRRNSNRLFIITSTLNQLLGFSCGRTEQQSPIYSQAEPLLAKYCSLTKLGLKFKKLLTARTYRQQCFSSVRRKSNQLFVVNFNCCA